LIYDIIYDIIPSKTGKRSFEKAKGFKGDDMSNLKDLVNKYSYQIEFDADDEIYVARCAELPSIAAHGKTQEAALKEIKVAALATLEWIQKDKEMIPEPLSLHKFNGKYALRMPPEIHRRLVTEANLQGISLNQLIVSKL